MNTKSTPTKTEALRLVEEAARQVVDDLAEYKASLVGRAAAIARATALGATGPEIVDACPHVTGKMIVSKDLARHAALQADDAAG